MLLLNSCLPNYGPIMRIKKLALFSFLIIFSIPSFGLKYFFTEDLGIQGNIRRCKYSNGQVYTVNSINLCPMSVDGPSPSMGTGTGFYKATYLDGMTRVCIYDVLGSKRGIRVSSTDICPLAQEF